MLITTYDGQALLFDAESGIVLSRFVGHGATVMDDIVGEQRRDSVLHAVDTRDGQRVLTTSSDKTARLWTVAEGEPLISIRDHTDSVNDAAVRLDDRMIATVSRDGTLIMTPVFAATQDLIEAARRRPSRQLDKCQLAQFSLSDEPIEKACVDRR